MTHIAVLGTGLLGGAFVEGLLQRGGCTVTVWNRTRSKAEALVAFGAVVADSPLAAVQQADRVHLVLLDDDAVDSAVAQFKDGLKPGAVIVDHTTTQPQRTAARASALDTAGLAYLHAPVMMGPPAARAATGMMLVAGPNERVARVHDALAAMTGELWHVGERNDLAAVYKLFGNAGVIGVIGILGDIMRMADSANVPREGVLDMFAKMRLNGAVAYRGPMMRDESYGTQFALTVARKDLRLMLETSGNHSVDLLRALASRMDQLMSEGAGDDDFAVLGRADPKHSI